MTALPEHAEHPRRKRWTRDDVWKIAEAGLIEPQRFELIDGVLIEKMPQARRHANSLTLMALWLSKVFGELRVEQRVSIDVRPEANRINEPEPDAIVTRGMLADYRESHPGPEDILLAVEISDSTLSFDRGAKAALYAQAGIPDYWVFDTNGRRLIVHRQPEGGRYTEVIAYFEGESVAPLAAPGHAMPVSNLIL